MANARDDVLLGLFRDGKSVTILPFQLGNDRTAIPAGFPLADYQGFIGPSVSSTALSKLLRKAKVRTFQFNHVPREQTAFAATSDRLSASPIIGLEAGLDNYIGALKDRSGEYTQAMRKLRSLQREHGTVSFQPFSKDPGHLKTLIEWKSEQYRRTNARDMFAEPWFKAVVETTSQHDSRLFRGALSVLSLGTRPIAIHYGLISDRTWHYWFPAYDPDFGKYSPGMNLLLLMIEAAPKAGIEFIDLGKGQGVRYKDALKTHEILLVEGTIFASTLEKKMRDARRLLGGIKRSFFGK